MNISSVIIANGFWFGVSVYKMLNDINESHFNHFEDLSVENTAFIGRNHIFDVDEGILK